MQCNGKEQVPVLRREMNAAMESGAGIYRSKDSLEETCRILEGLWQRYARIELHDKSNVYNSDLTQALELGSMLDVARAIATSALNRKESRGSHQRLDHPERDDENFLTHSLAHYRAAEDPELTYKPVTITKSRPSERVYGGTLK